MTKEEISKEFLKLSTLEKLEIILDDAKMGHLFHNYKYREEIQKEKWGYIRSNKGLHGKDTDVVSLKSFEIERLKNGKYSITFKKGLGELGRIFAYETDEKTDCVDTHFTLFDGTKIILEILVSKDENYVRLFQDQKILKLEKMKKNPKERDSFVLKINTLKEYNLNYKIIYKHEDVIFNKDTKWLNS
jgi:hypothetical protein